MVVKWNPEDWHNVFDCKWLRWAALLLSEIMTKYNATWHTSSFTLKNAFNFMLYFHINALTCTLTSPQALVTKWYCINPPFCSLTIKLNNWDGENLALVQNMARFICIWLCALRYNIQIWVVLNFCLKNPFYFFFFFFWNDCSACKMFSPPVIRFLLMLNANSSLFPHGIQKRWNPVRLFRN